MPPSQCPACARFLRNALVEGLAAAPASCPGCGELLHASQFADSGLLPAGVEERDGPASVRPPDLAAEQVVAATSDPLQGWDRTGPGPDPAALVRGPFPVDAAVVAGATALGLVAGALVTRRGRLAGAALGATLGLVAGAAGRRVWRLEA